ncbi:hypothetical protein [Rummeliibacillus pycnus]|uniref:hypothetical protein n=1 Tax=Rummeliibacillus pycnus TaxID=101070 RepID=UPI0037C74E39
MKSLYQIFNLIKLDTSAYDDSPLTNFEQKQIKKRLQAKIEPKRDIYKRNILSATATCGVIATVVMLILTHFPSDSSINHSSDTTREIVEKTDILKATEDDPYTTIVNQTVKKDEGTMTVETVNIDAQNLYIKLKFKPSKSLGEIEDAPLLFLNGEKINPMQGTIDYSKSADKSYEINVNYTIPKVQSETLQIQLQYNNIYLSDRVSWDFDFKISTTKLIQNTKTYTINKRVNLPNKQYAYIKNVVVSPTTTTFNADIYDPDKADAYQLYFKMADDLGTKYRIQNGRIQNKVKNEPDSYMQFVAIPKEATKETAEEVTEEATKEASTVYLIPCYVPSSVHFPEEEDYVEMDKQVITIHLK